MKICISKNSLVFIIIISSLYINCAQTKNKTGGNESETNIKTELESINSKIENLYATESVDSLIDFYNNEFTYLPEYKPTIYALSDLKKFYIDWFNAVDMGAYHKKIYQVEMIDGYVLEIGNFSLHYSTKLKLGNEYSAKYMIMWKRNAVGKLKIISEAFGADKYINPEEMPYASVEVKDRMPLEKNILDKKIQTEIEEFDKGVVKAVIDGDGQARADEFTQDGIYLPHFDTMKIGMDVIKPYMLNTYHPGSFVYVINTYREIFNSGNFVFLSGDFKVGWDNASRGKGFFEGNMSNLMKRGKDGKLLMYRQLAHN